MLNRQQKTELLSVNENRHRTASSTGRLERQKLNSLKWSLWSFNELKCQVQDIKSNRLVAWCCECQAHHA